MSHACMELGHALRPFFLPNDPLNAALQPMESAVNKAA